MAFNINVANSCKILVLNGTYYDNTSTQATINIEHVETGAMVPVVMNYDINTGRGRIVVPVANLPHANGVYRACLNEQGIEYSCQPVIIHCDIDCCLTKLTNELMECSCDCARCSSTLAKAQKIYLLLESAASAAEIASDTQSDAYYQDILAKYQKAREICDNNCGCDC
tara:strand:- start:3093 stop:3599 length:507 start_codon:yes stop_codon:yes gene_type:complete